MIEPRRAGAVVLAAGASTRFGSPKPLALLDGRPLLRHVLDAVGSLHLGDVVIVLGRDAAEVAKILEPRDGRIVRNPAPEAGLSSSLRIGLSAVRPDLEAVLIVLGDQPRLEASVMARLLEEYTPEVRPVVVPAYAAGGGANPVLLGHSAWPLVGEATGDRGLLAILRRHPDLVQDVPVAGSNPDVDTPEDLAALEAEIAAG